MPSDARRIPTGDGQHQVPVDSVGVHVDRRLYRGGCGSIRRHFGRAVVSILLQDVTVSAIALGAAVTVVWRAIALFATKTTTPGCPSCASGCASRTPVRTPPADDDRRIIRPLVINAATASRRSDL